MKSMKKLPNSTIKLISSSQVISSIFSAVKELVENSIDADGDYIEIKLEDFGLKKIEVSDNGCGIASSEEEFVAKAHYTSKLRDHIDLMHLKTFGFRGEALNSICSLSNLSFSTKTELHTVGRLFNLNFNGEIVSAKLCTREQGTTFCCENIFKNVPVRKQFYSSKLKCKDQLKKIEDLLHSYSLIFPEIHFIFKHNKSVVWQKAKTKCLKESFISLFGVTCFQQMSLLNQEDENKNKITLILPNSNASDIICRNSYDRIFIFVNKRPVYLKEIGQIVKMYCCEGVRCLNNKYPIAVVHLEISSSNIDVNVNPNKTQIFLENLGEVKDLLTTMLSKFYQTEKSNCNQIINCERVLDDDEATKVPSFPTDAESSKNNDSSSIHSEISQHPYNVISSTPNEMSTINAHFQTTEDLTSSGKQLTNDLVNSSSADCSDLVNSSSTDFSIDLFEKADESGINKEKKMLRCNESKSNKCKDLRTSRSCLVPCLKEDVQCIKTKENKKVHENKSHSLQSTTNRWNIDQGSTSDSLNISTNSFVIAGRVTENRNDLLPGLDIELPNNKKIEENDNYVNKIEEIKVDEFKDFESSHNKLNCLDTDQIKEIEQLLEDDEFIFDFNLKDRNNINIEEHSLTQTKIDNWSRGTAFIDGKTKKPIQPVQILRPSKSNIKDNNRKIENKINKKTEMKTKNNYKTSMIKRSRTHYRQMGIEDIQTEVHLRFSLDELKQFYSNFEKNTNLTSMNSQNVFDVIGKLSSLKAWIVEHQKKLYLLNHTRLNEMVIFKQLIKKHEIPSELLSKPVTLNESLVGGRDNWSLMQNLNYETIPLEKGCFISDKRITANGFKILRRKNIETGDMIYEITHLTKDIPNYSINGLKDILDMIHNHLSDREHRSLLLESCRPKDVTAYLKAEATRLASNDFHSSTNEDIAILLQRLKSDFLNEIACANDRSIFYQIGKSYYDYDD